MLIVSVAVEQDPADRVALKPEEIPMWDDETMEQLVHAELHVIVAYTLKSPEVPSTQLLDPGI